MVSHLDKHQLAGTLYNIKCVAALLIRPRKVTQIYIEPAVTFTTGHIINLTNIMSVLKEVADLKRFCEYAYIPKEMCDVIFASEETEHIGRISSCWLEMKMSWSQMKEVLSGCNETKAADIAELMKQYICKGVCNVNLFLQWILYFIPLTDAPLTTANVFNVIRRISNWKQFCKHLHLQDQMDRRETVEFFIKELYFEASWGKIALALYHSGEECAIDDLFNYMKSPAGGKHTMYSSHELSFFLNCLSSEFTLTFANIQRCLHDNVPLRMWKILHRELRVPPAHVPDEKSSTMGIKIWLLLDPGASWHTLAMGLYSLTLNGALKQLKAIKMLPKGGVFLLLTRVKFIHLYYNFE